MSAREMAKELLAAQFEASGRPEIAAQVRRGHGPGHCTPLWMDESLRAIEAALSPQGGIEGVLVEAVRRVVEDADKHGDPSRRVVGSPARDADKDSPK